MKLLIAVFALFSLFCTQAFAHTDHGLGNGAFHEFYHIAFWLLFAAVVLKAIHWHKSKKTSEKTKSK